MHGVIVISWGLDSSHSYKSLCDLHLPSMHLYLRFRVFGGQSLTVLQRIYPIVKEYNKLNVIRNEIKTIYELQTKEWNLKRMEKNITLNIICNKK